MTQSHGSGSPRKTNFDRFVESQERNPEFKAKLDEAREHFESEAVCEFAGHDWADAGGGLLICINCQEEKWA